jgi:glyoxylase-like metal-dependent hydrolase (beta-lactamase superfamily II)
VAKGTGKRVATAVLGRGERVLPGVYRLRLPLPWPGVPHGNAWAVSSGDGIVLFDTGIHGPGSLGHLERALAMCGLALEDVRLLVCTHAHSDHYGQAATIIERAGCELWMHPNFEHARRWAEDPEASLLRRLEIARQSGVPEEPLRRYAEERGKDHESGIAAIVDPDRALLPGVLIQTDLGPWTVHETPGHAPSHVCLFQPERRLLISGDHLLGRISLYFDYGYSADPVGEFVRSLDVVAKLGARLCLPGHGRTFTDVHAHIQGNRALVDERLEKTLEVVAAGDAEGTPLTAFEIMPRVYGENLHPMLAQWLLTETIAMVRHLEVTGRVTRISSEPDRWATGTVTDGDGDAVGPGDGTDA